MLVGLPAALLAMATVLFLPSVLNDGDTYWHLAAGEWMLAHAQVLHSDVFSFTWLGRPWQAHEWLSEAAMALAFRAGGWSGLLALFAVALAGAFALLAWRASRHLSPIGLLAVLYLAFAVMAPSLLVRPHLLVLPVLALWTIELLRAREAGRRPGLWLAPLMVLWANLHGSFVFGFVVLAPLALEAVLAAPQARWKTLRDWGAVGALCGAAVLLTPQGVEGVIHPLRIMSMGQLNAIVEWRPANFSELTPFELALLVTLFVCLHYGVRVPILRLVLLVFVLHMALQHQRHQIVLAVLAPLLLAEPLGRAMGRAPAAGRRLMPYILGLGVLGGALVAVRLAVPVTRTDSQTSPVTALSHVPTSVTNRPVLNSYGFGGYLIFRGVRPFIDGRADMYGDAFFARHQSLMLGRQPGLDKALADYRIAWTIVTPGEPLARAMDAKPGWRRLYADRYAVVHVRTDASTP